MKYTHVFEPAAIGEYVAALEWYNERSETAAKNFIKEIKEKIKDVCSDPLRYPNTYKHFREKSLKNIPFALFILLMRLNTWWSSCRFITTKEIPIRSSANLKAKQWITHNSSFQTHNFSKITSIFTLRLPLIRI